MTISDFARSARKVVFLAVLIIPQWNVLLAQSDGMGRLRVGGMVGDPLGLAMRYRVGTIESINLGFGPDYFGSPRLQLDYVWKINVFRSSIVDEYAGPGLAVAFAKGDNSFYSHEPHKESFASSEDNRFGVGGSAVFGFRVTPRFSPFQFFLEGGPLLPATKTFDVDFDGALGILYRL